MVGRKPFWIPEPTVIKKAALILFTFSALVGAHLVYTQGFALLAHRLAAGVDDPFAFEEPQSAHLLKSRQLAIDNFGPDAWMTKGIKLSYYDSSRGSYMYAQDYQLKNDGKTMEITPFAMISVSKDGHSHKTVTSDQAIITFNQSYGLLKKTSEPTRVVHAELIGNVRIRDDKGTPENPLDDLLIGPMTKPVAFDEKTMQITTNSDVIIQDQDMMITGTELMMQLRRKNAVLPMATLGEPTPPPPAGGGSSGYEAETAFLYKNVDILIKNVGPGGILPGQSKPDAQGRTPLHLQCAGAMRIDMPKPKTVVVIGPPNPFSEPEPTYARFEKNVRVTRGITQYDQLNCDMLNLTLKPDKKPAKADPSVPTSVAVADGGSTATDPNGPVTGSPMTQLKLRTAFAQGHDVWVQSESQGLVARCVELKYDKKLAEGLPDKTYLNGGSKRRLQVEKVDYVVEGPKAGSIKELNTLESIDAEILDYGPGMSRIVARGPGTTKSRPSRSESVARVAWFEDQMMLLTTRDAPGSPLATATATATDPGAALPPLRRVITLTGPSKLMDITSGSTLDAKAKIVAEFEAGPKPAGGTGGDGPSRIKWLEAFDNVHLATPGRTLTAWKKFDARFVQPDPFPVPQPLPGLAPNPVLAANPVAPSASAEAPLPESAPDAPPAPVEGAVDGRANYVYATISQGVGTSKGEVRDAKLRGGVMVHQDPAPGERFGKDASGEALDLFSQGKGLMKFAVAAEEPQANNAEAKTKLAAGTAASRPRLASRPRSLGPKILARVEFDGKVIESEKIIGLDQLNNMAWSLGHGSLVQMADQSLLDDKGLASDKKNPKKSGSPGAQDRLVITWNEKMNFFGRSVDKQGREVAKAEFRGVSEEVQTPEGKRESRRGVTALMTDSAIYCDTMDVYMDRVIDFSKANRTSTGTKSLGDTVAVGPVAPEPRAEIAMVEAWGGDLIENDELRHAGVDITSRKFFDDSKILKDQYRIQHTHVIYDKRTGDFEASGPGTVYLYQGALPKVPERPVVQNVSTITLKPIVPPPPTMKLTKIQFTDLMKGRFGMSREGADPENREGDFLGQVQTANAVVKDSRHGIDFDRLDSMPDAVFLTSDALRVRSEPPPRNSKLPDHQLLYAAGNAGARTIDRLIQADRITYDSATELMYAYGDEGKEVLLVEQKSPGQVANRALGTSLRYNKATRHFDLKDPQGFQIYDLKSGIRPKALYPDLGGTAPKTPITPQQRLKFQRPARNATERSGFTGH